MKYFAAVFEKPKLRLFSGHIPKALSLLLLLLLLFAVYLQTIFHDFIVLDDAAYVVKNPYVIKGLTAKGFFWAFKTFHAVHWHPLTWLSLMVDSELFGIKPGFFHLTNVILHIANSFLLLSVLKAGTGSFWKSFFVAAIFALHPLNVEPVAWASERKEVLATFFMMLTLLTYISYCKNRSIWKYFLALFTYSLGLMSKPMIVSLPFLMVFLDYWPLRRYGQSPVSAGKFETERGRKYPFLNFIYEKIPFFVLSLASCLITIAAASGPKWRALSSLDNFPFNVRIANSIISYIRYIGKALYPDNLSIFYPHLGEAIPVSWVVISAFLLLTSTVLIFKARKSNPYLIVGWAWYLIALVPVIGLIQVYEQSIADRFTYVSMIGIYIAVVWTFSDLVSQRNLSPNFLICIVICVFSVFTVKTYFQVKIWQNSVTLFENAAEKTENNYVAHLDLYIAYSKKGNWELANRNYRKALEINPPSVVRWHNMQAVIALREKRPNRAIAHAKMTLNIESGNHDAINRWGIALVMNGNYKEAELKFREALKADPNFIKAHKNLKLVLEIISIKKRVKDYHFEI